MSLKKQTHSNDKGSAKQKSPKRATKNPDTLALRQTLPTTTLQRVRLDPSSLTPREVLQLQRAVGNRVVYKLLTKTGTHSVIQAKLSVGPVVDKYEQEADRAARQMVSQISTPAPTSQPIQRQQDRVAHLNFLPTTALPSGSIQRAVIQQNTVDGLTADLDTTDLAAAKGLINTLHDRGKRKSLAELYRRIKKVDKHNRKLIQFVLYKLELKTSDVPENEPSGLSEKIALRLKYWKANATDNVVQAGLRMWVTGDPVRGITWNMIGKHLRGRLTADEYEQIGTMHYMLEDRNNQTALADTYLVAQKINAGTQLLNRVRDDIAGSLDALPDHDGISYRQAGVADSAVYGGIINVGDYIRDTTFWSTSGLRMSGSAGKWGQDGTVAKPKVYFLINGSTGKYIAKYSGQEEGQHEILFKNLVTFEVTKIGNFRNETFFVHVTEIDPADLQPGTQIKNPYNGNAY